MGIINKLRGIKYILTEVENVQQKVGSLNAKLDTLNTRLASTQATPQTLPPEAAARQDILLAQEKASKYEALRSNIPGLFINTMPKSGSVYLMNTICKGLGFPFLRDFLAPGYFPYYYLMPRKIEYILKNQLIRQEHFNASEINIHVLEDLKCRFILHLRDPRQATLSWVHNCNLLQGRARPHCYNYTIHLPFDGYKDLPLTKQIDWHIETHLKSMAEWLQGWSNYLDRAKIDILVTHYEDLIKGEEAFFAKVMDFYKIPKGFFVYSPTHKDPTSHFRKGQADEWQEVFTDKQKARCDEIINEKLLKRFGWHKALITTKLAVNNG
ncbi:MAG: sulfotransferase domain-containing protein [Gammaproteobacteria bacterium]|nr:sulfotransferase domain-containing protein [Gammaproteobacteria bacterium]